VNASLTACRLTPLTQVEKGFQHGLAFCALVNGVRPGLIDISQIGEENSSLLMKTAFDTAESQLDIPSLLQVEDCPYDEYSLHLYLSYFYNKFSQEEIAPIPVQEDPIVVELRAQIAQLQSRIQENENEATRLHETIASLEEQNQDLKRQIDEDAKAHQLEQIIHSKDEEIKELQTKLEEANNKMAEVVMKAADDLEQLKEAQEDLQKQLAKTMEEKSGVEKKVRELTLKLPFFLRSSQSSMQPPKGQVTLVFTDVQSSTLQWEQRPDAMAASLSLHNKLMRDLIEEFRGYEVKTEGDAFMIAFSSAKDAIQWCLETQQRLLQVEWPLEIYEGADACVETIDNVEIYRGLRVRMGVHTGHPKAEPDPVTSRMDYFGPMVNRAARVEGTAHGGQIVMSAEVFAETKEQIENGTMKAEVMDMGTHRLKGLQSDTHLYQILPSALVLRTFPSYGAKPDEPEETAPKSLETEIDQLVKENDELRTKIEQLETDAQEAIDKAQELSKQLDEIAADLPPSLAKDFMNATNKIKELMRSQALVSASLTDARNQTGENTAELKELHKQLDESRNRIDALEKVLTEKDIFLDEIQKRTTLSGFLSSKLNAPFGFRGKKKSPAPLDDTPVLRLARSGTDQSQETKSAEETSGETEISESVSQDSKKKKSFLKKKEKRSSYRSTPPKKGHRRSQSTSLEREDKDEIVPSD